MAVNYEYGAATHVGLIRSNNEDSFSAEPELGLWLIADGMGGHDAGEVASQIAKDSINTAVRNQIPLTDAIEQAHKQIKQAADSGIGSPNMGTTAVALLIHNKHYQVAWVGDSRAYLWDQNKKQLTQISKDHSYVQSLVDAGLLKAEEMRHHKQKNVITQSLGVSALDDVVADSIHGIWQANQRILLCSDGLSDLVNEDELSEIFLKHNEQSAQCITDLCIQAALDKGGVDNVTVQVIDCPQKNQTKPINPILITGSFCILIVLLFLLLLE